jgi:phytoene dehydrogenase-like protein
MQYQVDADHRPDLVVVGGGLAGLIAASLVARAGRKVVVFEQSSRPGGRAITLVERGIHFNLGPHALYCRGHAFRLLKDLQVPFQGGFPDARRGVLLRDDESYPIPRGIGSVLSSRLLTLREKLRLLRLLSTLPRMESRRHDGVPLEHWIGATAGRGNLARFLRTLFRVSTYADETDRLSAGAAIEQLKRALAGNVWYLDGGWQSLIDGLREQLQELGVETRTRARVKRVTSDADGIQVELADGEELRARAAIMAIDPDAARELLDLPVDAPLSRWTAACIPIRAACLDVALGRLPRPDRCVAFGLDRPLYFSVHSASARLAPEGVAVLHVMKNLRSGDSVPAPEVESELQALLNQLQPGWRDHVLHRRFLPSMTVSHSLPLAKQNGLAGRPGVVVAEVPHVFLAGDWVGTEGMLADASAASAAEAARQVLATLSKRPIGPAGSKSRVTV